MKEDQAKTLGNYLKIQRSELGMSRRELARQAGVDTAYVSRLEQGGYQSPRPGTLKNIAEVLGLPLSDVFAMADYVIPYDLPNFAPYLRAKYGNLPPGPVSEMNRYFQDLAKKHGLDVNGPAPGEDERAVAQLDELAPEDLI